MDYANCNVVYVDRAAEKDKLVKRGDSLASTLSSSPSETKTTVPHRTSHLDANLQVLLKTFSEVHICTTGRSCIQKLNDLNPASILDRPPTIVLIDIPYHDQSHPLASRETREPSPGTKLQVDGAHEEQKPDDAYGLKLLQWVTAEIQFHSLSKLVVPVAIVAVPPKKTADATARSLSNSHTDGPVSSSLLGSDYTSLITPLDHIRTMSYLDIGAVDVLTSPLVHERLPSLGIHAYRAHREATKDRQAILEIKRGRKRSWIGINESQKPYAYLLENMVHELMDRLCKPDDYIAPPSHVAIEVSPERSELIATSIGSWRFSAHQFNDDELLHAALLMLQHALTMPEVEKWRVSTEHLTGFLVATRKAYITDVPYHNFRHVVDVLQAVFHFLVQLGRLPPYPSSNAGDPPAPSPISSLIRPFEALTLLITAIGHDVGHPGVNNAFLVQLNTPLAQLYSDRSVLEAYHCAAYSQILRHYWRPVFEDSALRKLMTSSILATDMQEHFDYIQKLGKLQEKLQVNDDVESWNGRFTEEQRSLACSLLIKCADISNVAREHQIAAQWTKILTSEFARQDEMEKHFKLTTTLFAPPVTEIIPLAKAQIGFMNMFALPLFQGVTDIMPPMKYCVDELLGNIKSWEDRISEARLQQHTTDSPTADGTLSPRSMSVAVTSDANQTQNDLRVSAMMNNSTSLINSILSKNAFTRELRDEGAPLGLYNSLPDVQKTNLCPEEDRDPTQDPNLPYFEAVGPRSSKPSNLNINNGKPSSHPFNDVFNISAERKIHYQISEADSESPLTKKAINAEASQPDTESSLTKRIANPQFSEANIETPLKKANVSEWVVPEEEPVNKEETPNEEKISIEEKDHAEEKSRVHDKQLSGDTTDWTSQATSATTGKMPLSPNTPGTSYTSRSRDSDEKDGLSTRAGLSNVPSQVTQSTASPAADESRSEGYFKTGSFRKSLKKQGSKVFSFGSLFHKDKSPSPSPKKASTPQRPDGSGINGI